MIHREGWSSTAAARSIGQTISDDPSIRGSELEQTYFYPTQNRVSTRIYVGPHFLLAILSKRGITRLSNDAPRRWGIDYQLS
jgi:hypothetical protein